MSGTLLASEELRQRHVRAIAIGGSAGGIEALKAFLPELPRTLPIPVFIALHVAVGIRGDRWPLVFADCRVRVQEAEDKDIAEAGKAYIAPPDYHLLVDAAGWLSLSTDPPVHLSRPSIDVLLQSAAWAYGAALLGIVLSGANADGAEGLFEIYRHGGLCWIQSPEEAATATMPRAALEAVPRARVLTLHEMAEAFRSIDEDPR